MELPSLPKPVEMFSKTGKALVNKPKPIKSHHNDSFQPSPTRKKMISKIQPFQKQVYRKQQPHSQGADRIYSYQIKDKAKGHVQFRKMSQRPSEKIDPEFRVYIDPFKNYQANRSFIDMKRQVPRSFKFMLNKSQHKSQFSDTQMITQTKLPELKFDKQIDRNYFYKHQTKVRDLFYKPNFQFAKKNLGKVGMNFEKQLERKMPLKLSACGAQNDRFDYTLNGDSISERKKSFIQFQRMKGRN